MANPTQQTQVSALQQRRQDILRELASVERKIALFLQYSIRPGGISSPDSQMNVTDQHRSVAPISNRA